MRPLVWCVSVCAPLCNCTWGVDSCAQARMEVQRLPPRMELRLPPACLELHQRRQLPSPSVRNAPNAPVCVWEGGCYTVRGVCVCVGLISPPFAVPLCCVVLTCRVPCPREPVRHSSCCGHAIRCKRRWAHVLSLMFALFCTVACHAPEYFEFFGMLECAAQWRRGRSAAAPLLLPLLLRYHTPSK